MVALGGVAVSYERGTPVVRGSGADQESKVLFGLCWQGPEEHSLVVTSNRHVQG